LVGPNSANSTAVGESASAVAVSSTALGQGSSANFANSTALGRGVATTRANQVAIGGAANTYTLAGVIQQPAVPSSLARHNS